MPRLRFVTAAGLFDGHDVSINIIRRMLQERGVEVIHLGHNRSCLEVVNAVLQEDAHAVAISSYQGGHNEYFLYIKELLDKQGATDVRIFGGGGGVITKNEIISLQEKGITKIYSPEDGMKLGLEGIIDDMITKTNYSTIQNYKYAPLKISSDLFQVAKTISYIEENGKLPENNLVKNKNCQVLGVTGTGGAGKSSLIDELLLRFKHFHPELKVALISVDPTKKKNQGALLGDRIRLGAAKYPNFYIRSLATRESGNELSPHINLVLEYLKSLDFNMILVETSGIGQASDAITKVSNKCLYVMTPEYGAQTQLEKIEMLDAASYVVLNKFERQRSEDALRDIRKQYKRNKKIFDKNENDEHLPIFGTVASHFNDPGVNDLYYNICQDFNLGVESLNGVVRSRCSKAKGQIVPIEKQNYLREISQICKDYNRRAIQKSSEIKKLEAMKIVKEIIQEESIDKEIKKLCDSIGTDALLELDIGKEKINYLKQDEFNYMARDKKITIKTKYTSLSGISISKVAVPHFSSDCDFYKFIKLQNIPGEFPFSAGIFPFRRNDEDPKRMFAGEGGPVRTNSRFHFLSKDDHAKRLSTAFDSVTLYGQDPDHRPDIFGKIGESGVSIATVEDMEDLYRGFKLTDNSTSVSMTINGPAPIILAMFMNVALRQELGKKEIYTSEEIKGVLQKVRGTVQADILKEDQAQNTCIFSLPFALKMMGDIQEYFSQNKIKNYYTVSISGYHIAEAGANPITQLAFTLANGFTYVEYYLSRGILINDFCENLSFFFSNGLDPEYTVIGRVARKIWAVVLKYKYNANFKSQKFKYHVQTSGRSLHAQEIDFNDIRTTLQAFIALSDNCNSLHTNAFDEAITTPTVDSVRRAMAIQMIINKEFGLSKTDNALQGSFIVDELSELVEGAVLEEFERISDKGGVLGAMESMYQRSKIQDESIYYENLKDSGKLPIVGVNTYLPDKNEEQKAPEVQLTRASYKEKEEQITRLNNFKEKNLKSSKDYLKRLKEVAVSNGNIFEELLTTVRYCSLGEITNSLFEIGGEYRRSV